LKELLDLLERRIEAARRIEEESEEELHKQVYEESGEEQHKQEITKLVKQEQLRYGMQQ